MLPPPEALQLGRDAEGNPEIIQRLRTPLRKRHKQRRQSLSRRDLFLRQAGARAGGNALIPHGLRGGPCRRISHLVQRDQLTGEVLGQQVDGAAAVAHLGQLWVCGYAHHARTRQPGEVSILKLLRNRPGNEVARLPVPPAELGQHRLLGNLALQADLQDADDVGRRR